MEEQVLNNHIDDGNYILKKENQDIKEFLAKFCPLYKADSEYHSQNCIDCKICITMSAGYKMIDLCLPSGTLWMDRNIGAKYPIDFGLYFAWGEIQGYTADEVVKTKQFSWTDYKYANGADNTLTKYCNKSDKGNEGCTDSLVTLQTIDDAVLQSIHKCSMPTKEQIQELKDNTTYEWTTQNGVNGGLFTSKINGNSIFVPAAGICSYGVVDGVGKYGHLWSSSLDEGCTDNAWSFGFDSGVVGCYDGIRYYGFSVRGVSIKQ